MERNEPISVLSTRYDWTTLDRSDDKKATQVERSVAAITTTLLQLRYVKVVQL